MGLLGGTPLVRGAAKRVCGRGATVFALHRVLPEATPCFEPEMVTWEATFGRFLDWLQENYEVMPMKEIYDRRNEPVNAERPRCALTFDDGWRDNYLYAFPQLKQRNLPATIFLPLRFIGTTRMFWQEKLWLAMNAVESRPALEGVLKQVALRTPWFPPVDPNMTYWNLKMTLLRRPAEEAEQFTERFAGSVPAFVPSPDRSFVDWGEVEEMRKSSISFGSHTLNHVLLLTAEPRTGRREIEGSREELKTRLGEEPCGFAYPWGALGPATRPQVSEAGYDFAVTVKPGLVTENTDRFLIPRIPLSESILDGGEKVFSPGKARLSFAKNILTNPPGENGVASRPVRKEKVKILFVLDQLTEWEGGTERQLLTLINTLDRETFEPEICFILPTRVLPDNGYPCPVHWVRAGDDAGNIFTRLWGLTALIRKIRPHIVQTLFQEGLILGTLASWLNEVPARIVSVRNSHAMDGMHRSIMRSIGGMATVWQCNSPSLWRHTNLAYGAPLRRIEILPNGLDLSQFVPSTPVEKAAVRAKLGIGAKGPVFIYVANMTELKDFDSVVRAAALLKPRFPDAEWLFVGDGPTRDHVSELADSLGIAASVKFPGRLADVRPYLAASDFAIQASKSEGSSNSLLEYMAMGLPSVVSDIPANRDLVEGVFFKPGDPQDLAEKILLLAEDTSRQRKLVEQYRATAGEFNLDMYALRVQSFYSRMAEFKP